MVATCRRACPLANPGPKPARREPVPYIVVLRQRSVLMDLVQIQLVQSSFASVEPIADTAAALFYSRLFELDPSLRPLFKGNLVEQGHKLMSTLKLVVNGLTRLEALMPAVRTLGRRHTGYGV